MSEFLRKCRGAFGLGTVWSLAWAALFAALSVLMGIVDPDSIAAGEGPLAVAGIGAVLGFVSGTVFAVVLALAERRRAIQELSLLRAALWGVLSSAALPLLTTMNNAILLTTCPIGATFAVATVALAKRKDLGPGKAHQALGA